MLIPGSWLEFLKRLILILKSNSDLLPRGS